ncbi:hypothetical protein [Streptomyces sp. NPDC003015]
MWRNRAPFSMWSYATSAARPGLGGTQGRSFLPAQGCPETPFVRVLMRP